jgi:SOS response associated peptidase (SRAP)
MLRTGMRDQHSIEMKDGSPSFIAGLWGGWQNPHTKEWLRTCVIITCEPNEMVAKNTPGCLSFCRRKLTMLGFQESPKKKSYDRILQKK